MAKISGARIRFAPSGSADVVGYKLYMEEASKTVSYSSVSFDLGNPEVVDGFVEVDLSELPEMTTYDGTYNIGVVAVDGAGNLSSMSVKKDVVLDFVAPDPPGEITILRD